MGKDDKTDAELDELFGYMTLFSCRGYDSGKSSYAIGYTVIKADGTDYDGAANLYYNATHTVAVRFVEVEPAGGEGTEKNTFVYTEVSPENNSTVETLSKIRMTYPVLSESVDYEQSIAVINTATGETVTQGTLNWEDYWGGSTVITFTLDAAITAAGTYSITVPEGLIYDDQIIWNDDDTMDDSAATYNPEFTLTYTVTGTATPKNTFNYLSVSPENNSAVETLSDHHETVSLHYVSHGQRGPLLDVIRRDRLRDRAVGYSLHGIHRDDLEMLLEGYPMRREASQGQTKTYVLALKLAQFSFLKKTASGTTPLLLLDDIFDKLDAGPAPAANRSHRRPDKYARIS